MKFVLALLLPLVLAGPAAELFTQFKLDYNKVYANEAEEALRFGVFVDNLALIAIRNAQEGPDGARHGVTQFADMTPEEFRSTMLGARVPTTPVNGSHYANIPEWSNDAVDWRGKATTPVKDQGQCGSCWAFSATEQIESNYILNTGRTAVLGPQQIVDCDRSDFGCGGGWTYNAYAYVIGAGGQELESVYPYTARDGSCKFQASQVAVKVNSWQYVGQNNEASMKNFVGTSGPLSVCLDAETWSSYTGGVLTNCGSSIDHCTQIVGYDTSASQPYWLVRNSWGTGWGEAGYIRLYYGRNTCAINSYPTMVNAS